MLPSPVPLTWNEALSGITGSISLASWIFLLIPQLIENYQQGSADGISLSFLVIWFVGDVTNLAGALWAGLVPTVTALAVYFCAADAVLIGQCLYYNALNRGKKEGGKSGVRDEEQSEVTPLLNGSAKHQSSDDVAGHNSSLPSTRRKSSTASSKPHLEPVGRRDSVERTSDESTRTRTWIKNTVSVVMIIVAGAAGWAVAWKTGAWRPSPVGHDDVEDSTPIGAEVLGYISAVCYLGARIPQIFKNQRERSCEGLSLLFFALSLLGNATYGAGVSKVLAHAHRCCWVLRLTVWRVDPLPLRRKAVLPRQPAMADWFAGYNGRRCGHFCAVFRLWGETTGAGR